MNSKSSPVEKLAEELLDAVRADADHTRSIITAHERIFVTVLTNLLRSQDRTDVTPEKVISGLIEYMREQSDRLRETKKEKVK